MSAPASVDDLLQLIRKSGMVDEGKLTAFLQRHHKTGGIPADPRETANCMIEEGVLTHFQAEQFLLGKWRGFTIGKFKLLERVGVGGMGQVFLCEHMFMKKRVAVKVLPPAKAEQPAALGRFYREARAAGGLEHPNIVRTHDIDQDGNLHFIVMEYVDGSNLLEIVKKFGPMEVGRAVHYTRQVASGLDFAFRSGLIHRDVKPGNILIDRRGNARVLDMGLARFFKDQSDMLTVKYDDKIVLGTADYVAPEQVANSHSVDVRADVYALGATLYFLLAGHPPFPMGTVSQKLLWHRTKEPTPIRQIRPDVPEAIAAIVTRMMAKDPGLRHQTPAEVVAALTPFVPAKVPPPREDEMPILCAAIRDGQEPLVEMEAAEEAAEPALVAVGVAPFAERADLRPRPTVNPFGPKPSNFKLRSLAQPVGSGVVSGANFSRHNTSFPEGSPLPGRTRNDEPPQDFTPSPFVPSRQEVSPSPDSIPGAGPYQRAALYAILAISVVVGGGIIYWKLFNPKFQPAPTSQPSQGSGEAR